MIPQVSYFIIYFPEGFCPFTEDIIFPVLADISIKDNIYFPLNKTDDGHTERL